MKQSNPSKKLAGGIAVLIILSICLCITTSALVLSVITVEGNVFTTGSVDINLNDGKPIIEAGEFEMEPGMTMVKEFFIQNNSTCNVYYRLYFASVSGELADVLEITISDGTEVLYAGTALTLNKKAVSSVETPLVKGERRTLTITFHCPDGTSNNVQNESLLFDLCAEAVQTQNNPNRDFE